MLGQHLKRLGVKQEVDDSMKDTLPNLIFSRICMIDWISTGLFHAVDKLPVVPHKAVAEVSRIGNV